MKANRAQLDRAIASPAETRLFLLYGPDEAGSRALSARIGTALGDGAERIDLTGADLKADPARLVDEAASISMFGGARWIRVEPAGDEATEAVQALIEAPVTGNPVALVAGALRPASRLLKLALAAPNVIAFASYVPDARDAGRLARDMGRDLGLVMDEGVAGSIAESAGGNRALIEQELAKFALYLDSSRDIPRTLDRDALDLLGAGAEGDLARLVDSVIDGEPDRLDAELSRLKAEGMEGISLSRALLRRMAVLARLRSEVEKGQKVGAVMASLGKTLFWKERDAVGRQVSRWPAAMVARAISRLIEAERDAIRPGGTGPIAIDSALFAICRQAARLR